MPLEYNSQSHFYTHKALFTVQKSVAFTGVTSLSQKDEGLSRPSWLAYSGWFTHINGHLFSCKPSVGQEKIAGQDQRSTH